MKKVLAILALALFLGGISATAVAATVDSPVAIELGEEEKKSEEKKSDKKEETTAKSGDCSKSCEEEKKSDCSKSCEGESKK